MLDSRSSVMIKGREKERSEYVDRHMTQVLDLVFWRVEEQEWSKENDRIFLPLSGKEFSSFLYVRRSLSRRDTRFNTHLQQLFLLFNKANRTEEKNRWQVKHQWNCLNDREDEIWYPKRRPLKGEDHHLTSTSLCSRFAIEAALIILVQAFFAGATRSKNTNLLQTPINWRRKEHCFADVSRHNPWHLDIVGGVLWSRPLSTSNNSTTKTNSKRENEQAIEMSGSSRG